MTAPASIIVAGVLVAAAIGLIGRYEITPIQYDGTIPTTWRLDRWTGSVQWCSLDPETLKGASSFAGATMSCTKK